MDLGYLRPAIRLKPYFAEALNHPASMNVMLGHLEESLAYFRRSVAVKNNFAAAHDNLGIVLIRLGRTLKRQPPVGPCRRSTFSRPEAETADPRH
jgi:hypothetical protein